MAPCLLVPKSSPPPSGRAQEIRTFQLHLKETKFSMARISSYSIAPKKVSVVQNECITQPRKRVWEAFSRSAHSTVRQRRECAVEEGSNSEGNTRKIDLT